MAEQRNNIYREYPRAAKLQLVRWREVDGLPQGRIIERAAAQWPDLPKIHSSTWRAWADSDDYADLLALVTGEQREREKLSELFAAAGGADALGDVARAAAYTLAAKAMAVTADASSAREIRQLMATTLDASRIAADEIREEYETRIEAIETEKDADYATLKADNEAMFDELEAAAAEVDRLTALCERAGIDTSGTRKGHLSEAARERIRQIYGIRGKQ